MPHPQPSAAPRTPAFRDLHWPAPHHLRLVDNRRSDEPERALLTLCGGEKLSGTVLAIDFDAGTLEFQPELGAHRLIPFQEFRTLFLTGTVGLERIPMALPPGSVAAKPKRDKRKCSVQLQDGTVLEPEVVSLLPRRAGLFLYVASYADAVLRWFVPAHALAHYRLGGEPQAGPAADAPDPVLPAANLGTFFAADGSESREDIEEALHRQKTITRRRLADLLVEDGLITPQQRDEAFARHKADRHKTLGDVICEMGAVTRETIRQVLVSHMGVPSVHLMRFAFDPNAIKALSPELARKHLVMPLYRSGKRIAVAMENPLSPEAVRELEFFTSLKVDPCLAPRAELVAAIAQFYGDALGSEKITQLLKRLDEEGAAGAPKPAEAPVTESDNTLVRLVNKMILDAYEQGASDIHIESRADDKPSRVRFRIDGVLSPYIEFPPNYRAALVSRLKIMAELDIAERRRPQDGKIRFEDFGPHKMELRVLTMPTAAGLEDVVMRILASPRALSVDQLALVPRDLAQLKALAARSFGLLLVCGPTGSGKTTTLHSLLAHINTPERKIWTVEDPVEITQDGLCQVQVNPKLGLSFPEVLRSFLRADPDVIMVGETRDGETARTVVAASLTGHLVFSTMHTNSAAESVARLLDLGVDPFNFSDALLGVLGQRLVRRLCACKTPHVASEEEIAGLAHEYCRNSSEDPADIAVRWRSRFGDAQGAITLHAPAGCPACEHTGYKGRLGVYELLVASPAIKRAIQERRGADEVLREAQAEGMRTLEQDAIEKILQGHLDLRQVRASCG